jgi:hypothetical protein
MATKTTTFLVDDLDGSDAEESILFGLDGASYEIDLNTKNAMKLREALAPFLDAGRRLRGTGTGAAKSRPAPGPPSGRSGYTRTQLPDARPGFNGQERASMRKFAQAHGLGDVAERGRIKGAIVDAWTEAGRPS